MICENISVSKDGKHLLFAGQDTVELAKKYGTPVYLLDEDRIREKCRIYKAAFQKYFGEKAVPLYASKANCFKRMYKRRWASTSFPLVKSTQHSKQALIYQKPTSTQTTKQIKTSAMPWNTASATSSQIMLRK